MVDLIVELFGLFMEKRASLMFFFCSCLIQITFSHGLHFGCSYTHMWATASRYHALILTVRIMGTFYLSLFSLSFVHIVPSHFWLTCLFFCRDVNKNNALVLRTKEIVFSSMRSQRNDVRPSCSRLVRRDMENQNTSCPEMDLPSTSSEEACARCRVYQKTNIKVLFCFCGRLLGSLF